MMLSAVYHALHEVLRCVSQCVHTALAMQKQNGTRGELQKVILVLIHNMLGSPHLLTQLMNLPVNKCQQSAGCDRTLCYGADIEA